jgi:hypothetical protein
MAPLALPEALQLLGVHVLTCAAGQHCRARPAAPSDRFTCTELLLTYATPGYSVDTRITACMGSRQAAVVAM